MDQMDMFSMKRVTVISSAPLINTDKGWFMYKPYETEMQLWAKNTDQIFFCCPVWKEDRNLLKSKVSFKVHKTFELIEFDSTNIKNSIRAIGVVLVNAYRIFKVMRTATHIHLRCPGNVGLIACVVQILFPSKKKTAKYAGNWDPNAKQPLSYRIQKWILSNTFLTKNMQVLVYGEWENQTKNIKPFFTATYSEKEIGPIIPRNFDGEIKFLFAGTLSEGKRPLYAIQLVQELHKKGIKAQLDICGEGYLKQQLQQYISINNLSSFVFLKGNRSKEDLLQAYRKAHFLILASKSEGWPKVVAEAMFWGCVPLATNISCVNNMLDHENRGLLLTTNLEKDTQKVLDLINNPEEYYKKAQNAVSWSQQYTTEKFESEIRKLI